MYKGIILIIVIMAVSISMGFGLRLSFPVAMIHILPPGLLLLSFSYLAEFVRKREWTAAMMVPLLWWMTFDCCKVLGNYYDTGILPELHPERLPWILGIYCLMIVTFVIIFTANNQWKKYKWRKNYGSRHHNYR